MSEVITNMKVRFGADTKQFKKGMNDGKKAVRTFKNDAGNAMEQFANQFGVSLGPLNGVLNKATLATKGLTAGFKGAAGGTGLLTKAMKFLKVALISTGIGAIVVALGSLIAYFTKTQRGADKISKVFKAIGAVVDVFVDRISAVGEKLVKIFTDPKQAISDLWDALKKNIVNRFEGILQLFNTVGKGMKALWERDWGGLKDAAAQGVKDIVQISTGLDAEQQKKFAEGVKGLTSELKDEAKAAANLEAARQKLRDQEIALIEIQGKRRKEIAAARLLAEEDEVAADKRLAAMQRAQSLENKTLEENKKLQSERIRIMEQEIALGESTADDYRQLAEEKAKLQDIEAASLKMQKRLQTEVNTLTNEIDAQTTAIIKQREESTKGLDVKIDSKEVDFGLNVTGLETEKLLGNLKPNLDEAKNVVLDFADVFNSTFEDLAVSFGENLGKLISGTGGFDDFGDVILSSIGSLAIQLGKIAIQTGITMKAIKMSFENPATAIAAGIGLVALGTAVKASISNAMNGSSGGMSGNAGVFDNRSTVAGVPAGNATQQPIYVNVSGEFHQRGSVAVATIKETNLRSKYRG